MSENTNQNVMTPAFNKDGSALQESGRGLVNSSAMGSFTNHASLQTSTSDAANILVVKYEAKVKRSLTQLRGGRVRSVAALSEANSVLEKSINKIGTAINKHNHKTFKNMLADFNDPEISAGPLANFLSMFGTSNKDIKGAFTCDVAFNSSQNEFEIQMTSCMKFSRAANLAEESVVACTMSIPVPSLLVFTSDQLSDILQSHPMYFPTNTAELVKAVLEDRDAADKAVQLITQIDLEISRLNTVLGEIPTLERAARAKITETQLNASGMSDFVENLTAEDDGMIQDLIGDCDTSFVNKDGKFILPVANTA